MQKWEYLHITSTDGRAHLLNDREIHDWKKGPDFYVYIEQLGEQGWELVNAEHMGGQVYHYFFKRPKQ